MITFKSLFPLLLVGGLWMFGCGGSSAGAKTQRFVFAANTSLDSLHSYIVGEDYSLTEVTSVATGDSPTSVVVTPDQKFVVVSHQSAAMLRVYQIAPNGHLSAAENPIVPLPSPARNIVLNRTRNMIYVACSNANMVIGFTIGSNGSLTNSTSVSDLADARGLSVSPSGNNLYVLAGTNSVAQFAVDGSGTLTVLNPSSAGTMNAPFVSAITPQGNRFYVASQSSADIYQYTINGGKLQGGSIPPSAPTTNGGTYQLSADRHGKFLFQSSNSQPSIGRMRINANGSLTPMTPVPYDFGAGAAICIADPSADILYAATQDGHIAVYDILGNGDLAFRTSGVFAGQVYGADFADLPLP